MHSILADRASGGGGADRWKTATFIICSLQNWVGGAIDSLVN
jgi:hypothetical protein